MKKKMERKIKKELIKASDSIKRKYRQLRSGMEEESLLARKHFEPLMKPLETLIDLTGKNQKVLAQAVKKEPKEEPMEQPADEVMEPADQHETEEFLENEPHEEEAMQLTGVKRRPKKVHSSAANDNTPGERRGSDSNELESPPYHENVFLADTNEKENDLWEEWERFLSRHGPLTRKYLDGMLTDTNKRYDLKFGPRCDDDKMQFRMGTTPIHFDNEDYIHVGGGDGYADGVMFPGTRGLFELIFKKLPDKSVITPQDSKVYKEILTLTSAHMQKYDPTLRLASSSSVKYNTVIKPLFKEKEGGALLPVTDSKIEYIHWDDVNELVGRLALLIASREAGNSGHEAEITSIESELYEGNYIE